MAHWQQSSSDRFDSSKYKNGARLPVPRQCGADGQHGPVKGSLPRYPLYGPGMGYGHAGAHSALARSLHALGACRTRTFATPGMWLNCLIGRRIPLSFDLVQLYLHMYGAKAVWRQSKFAKGKASHPTL